MEKAAFVGVAVMAAPLLKKPTFTPETDWPLRATTGELLRNVRYLNQVAVSMRAGLIDMEGAAQEIDFTEHELHEIITRLRDVAGVEDNPHGE